MSHHPLPTRTAPPRTPTLVLAALAVLATGGCAPDAGGPDAHQSGVSVDNRLVYNRLVYNRLVYNRLVYNRLVYNRLDATHLQLDADSGIETTEDGRDLLTYIARCALADGDVLVATHDGVAYEFPGLLALAPEWEYEGLSQRKQELVSACLLAHVNAFGDSVLISLRADGVINSSSSEHHDFPVYEATFFGQVFGDGELITYACQGDGAPIALAHSTSRARRVCSDPGSPCQIVSLGRCRDVCDEQIVDNGWRGCHAGGRRFDDTVSTYLFADDLDSQNRMCEQSQKHCSLTAAPATRAILECAPGDKCTSTCGVDGTCTLSGALAKHLDARVEPGALTETLCLAADKCNLKCDDASCELGCRDADKCEARCERGADCQIDCRGADTCDKIQCESGASCQLLCAPGARNCEIDKCWHPDGVVQCADGSQVCGRPCP